MIERQARIYAVDVGRETVALVAQIPEFAAIPMPRQARVEGWRGDWLYFSLFAYGGSD